MFCLCDEKWPYFNFVTEKFVSISIYQCTVKISFITIDENVIIRRGYTIYLHIWTVDHFKKKQVIRFFQNFEICQRILVPTIYQSLKIILDLHLEFADDTSPLMMTTASSLINLVSCIVWLKKEFIVAYFPWLMNVCWTCLKLNSAPKSDTVSMVTKQRV